LLILFSNIKNIIDFRYGFILSCVVLFCHILFYLILDFMCELWMREVDDLTVKEPQIERTTYIWNTPSIGGPFTLKSSSSLSQGSHVTVILVPFSYISSTPIHKYLTWFSNTTPSITRIITKKRFKKRGFRKRWVEHLFNICDYCFGKR
jgi:hypothetical protein